MARNMSSPAFLLAALVFFAATTLPAHAQFLPPSILPPVSLPPITLPPISNIPTLPLNVTGQLLCPNGTGGQPLNGTLVGLNCTNLLGVTRAVGQNVSNTNGTVTILANISLLEFGFLPRCVVTANLSGLVCPVLGTGNNVIVAIVQFLGTFLGRLLGLFTFGLTA